MKTMIATFLQKRLRMCGMLAAFAATAGLLSAQTLVARIASEVNGSELTVIAGSQHPRANPTFDAGRVPASTRLNGITIHFNHSAAQEADLDALLAAQQDPHSPQYHQWLTSDQFAARYGMAQADLDKVSSWLQQQGFTTDSVNRSRNAIRFSGNVGQVESAFQTQMHYYTAAGETHFAPSTALSIPAVFAPVVADIGNLNDFRPRAQHIVPRAGFTSGVSGGVFFAPGDIATAYDIKPLYSGGINGAGQTIAIMGQSFVNLSDIAAFQSAAGLTNKPPSLVLVPGTGNDGTISQGDEGESDLDLEWSSATAPGANVVLVYTGSSTNSGGIYTSIQYAVDEMIGNIVSLSYSSCEVSEATASFVTSFELVFKQAAAQGQTVMAASGDAGSTACSGDTALTPAQQEAIAVNYPASSAYVTGVGGTEIQAIDGVDPSTGAKGANLSTYWNSNYSGTSNVANDLVNSLIKYVPEVVWNDDFSGNANSPANLSSTGGGTSALVARPTWQTGVPGIPAGTQRLVPDIAFYSSPGLPGYLYCTSDTTSWNTGQTGSCGSGFRASTTDTSLTVAGGTSFATPIFAGMVALLNQKLNYATGQGLINPRLYQLAATSANYTSGAIHDVTSGNNNCSAGSTVCGTTTGGFSANVGYDEVTGIGSLDLNLIAAVWPANTGASAALIATSTTVSASNSAPSAGASVTFTITVASTSGTPTGLVTLQIDGGTAFGAPGGTTIAAQSLASNGTLTYATSFAATGPHQVLAQYAGDATHAPSVGAATISIAATNSGKGTIALAATNISVSQGSSGNSTITVTPSGGYLGTVDLTFTTSNDNALTNLCYNFTTITTTGIGTVVVPGTAAVTTQLTLDTLPADCGASVKGKGNHAFKALHASGKTRSDNRRPGTNSLPAGIALGGLLLAGFLARGSRRLRNLACVIALGAVGMALTACGGGGSSSTSATPDPPKGTYTVTVTGTDSVTTSITGTATFTFTIN
jgi:subtilase family serine protease